MTRPSQATVTLMWGNICTQKGFLTQNSAYTLVSTLNSKAIRSYIVNNHPTHILHPTSGVACALLTRKDRYSFQLLLLSLFCSQIPAPAILYMLYPSCEFSIMPVTVLLPLTHLNQPAITMDPQSSSTEPWHAMPKHSPMATICLKITVPFHPSQLLCSPN